MANKLQLEFRQGGSEAAQAHPCLCCAVRVVVDGGPDKARVTLTQPSEVFCGKCACALHLPGCTNKPRRGGGVSACGVCVRALESIAVTRAPSGVKAGPRLALELLRRSATESLTKAPLHEKVSKFSSSALADALYKEGGKLALATCVVAQIAVMMQDQGVAHSLKRPPISLAKKNPLHQRKGGGGLSSRTMILGSSGASWEDRTSNHLETSGDAPLENIERASEKTRDRFREIKADLDETNVDELLQKVVAADAAAKLEARLAHARSPAMRRTASSQGDRLQELVL